MAIGYRAILRLDPSLDATEVAERQLRAWLEPKQPTDEHTLTSVWDGPGVHKLWGESELIAVERVDARDNSFRRLYRFIDRSHGEEWITSVYAASLETSKNDYPQTIVIESENPKFDQAESIRKIGTPRLVGRILASYRVSDGSTPLTSTPFLIDVNRINDVRAAILDPERTASVIVAGSVGKDLNSSWRDLIAQLTRQSIGQIAAYILDPEALTELNDDLPSTFRILPGQVRTYAPKVQPEVPGDSDDTAFLARRQSLMPSISLGVCPMH